MTSWIDVFSLVATTLSFVGAIVGILYAVRAVSAHVQSVKTSLEGRGVTISREGVALKTRRRFDRDAYVDATQRGLVKALGAATVGSEASKRAFLSHSQSSADDASSTRAEHEKRPFGWARRKSE